MRCDIARLVNAFRLQLCALDVLAPETRGDFRRARIVVKQLTDFPGGGEPVARSAEERFEVLFDE